MFIYNIMAHLTVLYCTKPKVDINCKLVPQIWLVDWKVDPGSTKMLIQEHLVLGEIMLAKKSNSLF